MSSTGFEFDNADRDEYPQFETGYAFDERRNPSEVTIYSESSPNRLTEWLTAPLDYSLPVEECR